MSDAGPPQPQPEPQPPPGPAAAPEPQPEPADVGPPSGPGDDASGGGGGSVPVWLIAAIVVVVLVVVGVVVAILVLGDDDGGGPDVDVEGGLPDQVSTSDAASPVVQMLNETEWDLDGSTISTQFGNTCGYQGPESFLACTLIGGDPDNRRAIEGADLANLAPIPTTAVDPTDPVAPDLDVIGGAQLVSSVDGCPGSVRLHGFGEPIGQGPAVCILTDQDRLFAMYLTHVTPEAALSLIAVEVAQ